MAVLPGSVHEWTRVSRRVQAALRWAVRLAVCLPLVFQSALAEEGVTDQAIRIGMTSPLSGPNGAYGAIMRDTIERYFESINKAGGIAGRKLYLDVLDDGYESDRAVENVNTLVQTRKVFALVGSYGSSPTTDAMNKAFGPAKVPLIGTISGADTLRGPITQNSHLRYMFNVRASYRDETRAIVSQLTTLGIRRIAVVYQDDGFGRSGLEGATAAMEKFGLKPAAVASIPRNSIAAQAAVDTISKASPQAVIMVTLYKPTAEFVRGMKKLNQNPQFIALSPVGAELLVKELGPDARGIGISQVVPDPVSPRMKLVRDYQQLLGEGNRSYTEYGVEAYAMARVLTEAIRQAGRSLTRESLIRALETMNDWDLGGFKVSYSPQEHVGSSYVEISVIGGNGRVMR